MNISNLIIQLQAKLSDSTYDQLAITKSIELLKTGRVNFVEIFTDLPPATQSFGFLYYVRGDGLYWSTGDAWLPIGQTTENVIWAWGLNGGGQLGDDSTTTKSSPVSVVGGFPDWCQVSGLGNHSLAIRQNGTAWAWGCNTNGRLGDNSTTNRSSPVSVVGGFTDWCRISGGTNHSLAIRQNGTAWAWGLNGQGQLGDNTITSRPSPVSVVGGFTDWCQVSGGFSHSLAVRQNGEAWAWGCNATGQLGDDTITSRRSPVSVVGGFTDWCQISGGASFSLAVRQNGTAWAWGCNPSGQLGDDTIVSKRSPVSVVGGFTDWCQISGGNLHSVAVRQNGEAWAWGLNSFGQLGDNTTTQKSSPVSVVGGFTDWCQVSGGCIHSFALRQNGEAWSWGRNSTGVLGDGTGTNRASPVSVVGGFTDWCQISSGNYHSLGVRSVSL